MFFEKGDYMAQKMVYNTVLELIGDTPLVKINQLVGENQGSVYVKLEGKNPAGSVKDRVALHMVEKAEASGRLKQGMRIVEPTSGNTGIALAMVGALKGYEVTLVMPETMSAERRMLMSAYGAKIILTSGSEGMKGAIEKAESMSMAEDVFIPSQFENSANPSIHYETTAQEILKALPDIDIFVVGVGTGGTITGVGRRLKELRPCVKIIGVEPKESAVLSGNAPGKHKIQGIGAGFIPKVYGRDVVDEIIAIDDEDVFSYASQIAKKEGLLLGISAVANVLSAVRIAKTKNKECKIVTLAPDDGYKYLSTGLFSPALAY